MHRGGAFLPAHAGGCPPSDLATVPALRDMLRARLAAVQSRLLTLGHKNAREKLACFLLEMSERLAGGDDAFTLPMSRYDIADYLCLSSETVFTQFTQLMTSGIIALPEPKRVHILRRRPLEFIRPIAEAIPGSGPSGAATSVICNPAGHPRNRHRPLRYRSPPSSLYRPRLRPGKSGTECCRGTSRADRIDDFRRVQQSAIGDSPDARWLLGLRKSTSDGNRHAATILPVIGSGAAPANVQDMYQSRAASLPDLRLPRDGRKLERIAPMLRSIRDK